MSGEQERYLDLIRIAEEEARRIMRGRPIGNAYSVEDIAQEILVTYFTIEEHEGVENPPALIRTIARNKYKAALKRESYRKADPLPTVWRDEHILLQHWENREIAREELVRLPAKNNIQRGIIQHSLDGFDVKDAQDRNLTAFCLNVSEDRLTKELHRLKVASMDESAVAVPMPKPVLSSCICHLERAVFGHQARFYRTGGNGIYIIGGPCTRCDLATRQSSVE